MLEFHKSESACKTSSVLENCFDGERDKVSATVYNQFFTWKFHHLHLILLDSNRKILQVFRDKKWYQGLVVSLQLEVYAHQIRYKVFTCPC